MAWTDRIGRRIKLHDLHLLAGTVEAGSMGRAAQVLNTSQPAISRAVSDLEQLLGVPLLERGPRGIHPTPYGRALLDSAMMAFDSLRAGVRQIAAMADPAAGELRIGGNEAMIASLLPQIMAKLLVTHPKARIQVRHVMSVPQQYTELRERQIDVILGRVVTPIEDDTEAEILYQETTHVVAGARSKWGRRRAQLRLEDLLDEPWALPPPGTLVGALFAEAFRAQGLAYPSRSVVLGSIHVHCALVAGGDYLAILPGSVVQQNAERMGLRMLAVQSPVAPSPVGLMYLKRRDIPPILQAFIDCTRACTSSY